MAAYLQTQEAQCLVNEPRALLKMQTTESGAVNLLTMQGCEVTNMLYAVNSVFGLTPIGGILEVSDSTFSQLNICGAIVKNRFSDVGAPDVLGYTNYEVFSESQRITLGHLKAFDSAYNANPYDVECTADVCESITLSGCTFSEIPFLA